MEGVEFALPIDARPAPAREDEGSDVSDEDPYQKQRDQDAERNALNQRAAKESNRIEASLYRRATPPKLPELPEAKAAEIRAARYRVTGSVAPISIDGQRISFRVGKELDSNQFDVEYLKRHGVKLEAI